MSAGPAVPREAAPVRREWLRLAVTTAEPPGFDPLMITALPAPARRWLTHAIAPGTPLRPTVQLFMRGQTRIGQWRPFTARQVLAPPVGYIWAATAPLAGLPVSSERPGRSTLSRLRVRQDLHRHRVRQARRPPRARQGPAYLRAGDVFVITRLSRAMRSLKHLLALADELRGRGVGLVVLKQQIDTTTPTGRLVFHILGAIDEFQRELTIEGTREGLEAARARGRTDGRKPKLNARQAATVRRMHQAAGPDGKRQHTVAEIAEAVGVHRTTVYDYLRKEADMADGLQDAPRHAGRVVRRVLLRRNIAIDTETAQLVADAVQAALRTDAPSRPPRRRRRVPPAGCAPLF